MSGPRRVRQVIVVAVVTVAATMPHASVQRDTAALPPSVYPSASVQVLNDQCQDGTTVTQDVCDDDDEEGD